MSEFSTKVTSWQRQHGRHDLPWQNTTNPYAIWVSEIMLQQTQVVAVIAYYQRFMARFPDIASLANATQEEVLQHWSGLGYYSRARNLHHAAQKITDNFGGVFPQHFDDILSLPGIGRSTAAAISTFAFNLVQPILDGNVKRVFARHFLIEGWTGTPKVEAQLWQLSEQHIPNVEMVAYTQGLMDLGATVCTRSKPQCSHCPLISNCKAYQMQRVNTLPTPRPRKTIPEKSTIMLIFRDGDEIMLEKRPSTGIWGGLWSFPEVDTTEDLNFMVFKRFGIQVHANTIMPKFSHTFTHFKLHILPQVVNLNKSKVTIHKTGDIWLSYEDAISAAVPTPVRNILLKLPKS